MQEVAVRREMEALEARNLKDAEERREEAWGKGARERTEKEHQVRP